MCVLVHSCFVCLFFYLAVWELFKCLTKCFFQYKDIEDSLSVCVCLRVLACFFCLFSIWLFGHFLNVELIVFFQYKDIEDSL